MVTGLLLWIGFIRRYEYGENKGKIRWPFYVWPRTHWKFIMSEGPFALFRNMPGVIKWVPGRLLPRRWGFRFLVFEFGDRG